jgi:crotonobetainyl-CoA:carnitine CoA-transferase CaiB-like acyl-CoA transferase
MIKVEDTRDGDDTRQWGLIYASISGYGQTGPYAGHPGYDAVAQAVSAHPQVIAREMVVETGHREAGRLRMIGSPVKLSEHPPSVRSAPPGLGEHTDEVLTGLGLTGAQVAALRTDGVIR